MELWIRSQDRENLIQSTRVFIAFDKNIATWDRNNMIDLGKYATKERALEVLDDIHRLIKSATNPSNMIFPTAITYEMPLE